MTPLEDLHAIAQLQRTYAKLNDAAQWQELAELFTEDARLVRPNAPEQPLVGRAAILQSLLARPTAPARQHLVANQEVELIDTQHARATCYSVLLTHQDSHNGTVTVGQFEDWLLRTDAGWRFQSRTGSTVFHPVPYTQAKPALR
jgi:3-phenylpropionate/cinnamic acid dioxygenase small subunit